MKAFLDFVRKHIIESIVLIFIIIPIAAHILFKSNSPMDFFTPTWSSGEILGYIGTMTLAVLAVWQNMQAERVNKNLQINNIKFQKTKNDKEELEKIKKIISDIMLSFDVHVFNFALNNLNTDIDTSYIITNFQKARVNAYNSSMHFVLIKYKEECITCNKPNCVRIKSEDFIRNFLDFKNLHKEYLEKYIATVDTCLDIFYKLSGSQKRNHMAIEFNDRFFNTIFHNSNSNILSSEEFQKMFDEHKKNIEKFNANIYTISDMEKELSVIMNDMKYLPDEGYKELGSKAYFLAEQCDIQISGIYNKMIVYINEKE